MRNPNEKQMAEQATGCKQQGELVYYNKGGEEVTAEEAAKLIQKFETIEVPAAGAGSYRKVFAELGFEDAEILESSSSAGDWTFGVKDEMGWVIGFQENRYPYHGFKYTIGDYGFWCETIEQLDEEMEFL